MKLSLFTAALFAVALPAMAADVGVSINIGQPGFYGRIDIGNAPQPRLIYSQPMVIERQVRYVEPPLYLRVPPGHAKDWAKHCRSYNACNKQVYFVHDDWYNDVYVPHYRNSHDDRRDNRDYERDDERGHDKHDKHDKHGNGHDNGHGKGHDKDHDRD
jgi:hypothetical protein